MISLMFHRCGGSTFWQIKYCASSSRCIVAKGKDNGATSLYFGRTSAFSPFNSNETCWLTTRGQTICETLIWYGLSMVNYHGHNSATKFQNNDQTNVPNDQYFKIHNGLTIPYPSYLSIFTAVPMVQ